MTTKNKAISINAKLSNLARKNNITFQSLTTTFLIERLLARVVSNEALAKKLVFKGGYVGFRVYNSERYTIDLDALLLKADLDKTLLLISVQASEDFDDGTWFELETQIDLKTQGEYGGVRLVFRGGIGEKPKDIKKAQTIHFDLGIGDPVIPSPVFTSTSELIGEDEISWYVYPIETIIAEKLQTLIVREGDNSRAKDIYDLYFYLPKSDPKILIEAIQKCFEYRETAIPNDFYKFLSKIDTSLLKRGWPSATASLRERQSFDETFELILTTLKSVKIKK